jgi:deoxyadenosine/deoxycytidine kinase
MTSKAAKMLAESLALTMAPNTFRRCETDPWERLATERWMIDFEGLICSGKTHLVQDIGMRLEAKRIPHFEGEEKVPEQMLARYYRHMRDRPGQPNPWSLPFQIEMLNRCKRNYLGALHATGRNWGASPNARAAAFEDRGLLGNTVFAAVQVEEGYMDNEEYSSYLELLHDESVMPYQTNRLVYVFAPAAECQRRNIVHRQIEAEQGIPLSYLEKLEHGHYVQFYDLARNGESNIIVIRNDPFLPAEQVLDLLLLDDLPQQTRDYFHTRMPNPHSEAGVTYQEIADALDRCWREVTLPRITQQARESPSPSTMNHSRETIPILL